VPGRLKQRRGGRGWPPARRRRGRACTKHPAPPFTCAPPSRTARTLRLCRPLHLPCTHIECCAPRATLSSRRRLPRAMAQAADSLASGRFVYPDGSTYGERSSALREQACRSALHPASRAVLRGSAPASSARRVALRTSLNSLSSRRPLPAPQRASTRSPTACRGSRARESLQTGTQATKGSGRATRCTEKVRGGGPGGGGGPRDSPAAGCCPAQEWASGCQWQGGLTNRVQGAGGAHQPSPTEANCRRPALAYLFGAA
jgi:hypothetical protein